MTKQNTEHVVSLLEDGIVAYSKFMVNAMTSLRDTLDKMAQVETEWQSLRNYERELQRLDDNFSFCKMVSRNARIVGQNSISDDEYRALSQSWSDLQPQYQTVIVLSSRICSLPRCKSWGKNIHELNEARDQLDDAINREMRQDIPTCIHKFSMVLESFKIEVSLEVDRPFTSRWQSGDKETQP